MRICFKHPAFSRVSSVRLSLSTLVAALLVSLSLPVLASAAPSPTTTKLSLRYGGGQTDGGAGVIPSIPYGNLVTLAAVVISPDGVVLPGQVRYCEIETMNCAVAQLTADGSSAVALLPIQPAPGSHSYIATFLGTSRFAASTSDGQPLGVQLGAQTTTTLTSTGSSGNYTLNARIALAGTTRATGTVTFRDTTSNVALGTKIVLPDFPALSLSGSTAYTTGTEPAAVITADFNGDGVTDIAFLNTHSPTGSETHSVGVLIGHTGGTFTSGTTIPTADASAIATGDFNDDGVLDLVVAQAPYASGGNSSLPGRILVLLGKGDGTFQALTSVATGAGPTDITVGDFNGDGNADLAVTGTPYLDATNQTSVVTLLTGNGQGSFTVASSTGVGYDAGKVVAQDFNSDGKLDFAVLSGGRYDRTTQALIFPASVVLELGKGDGTFQAGKSPYVNSSYTSSNDLYSGDFDGDNRIDLLISTGTGSDRQYRVLFGDGEGNFRSAVDFKPDAGNGSPAGTPLSVADLNGDGQSDLAFVSSASVKLLTSNGDGTFTTASRVDGATSQPDYYAVATADFNQDGVPDIVTVNSDTLNANVYMTHSVPGASIQLTGVNLVGLGSHAVTATYNGDPGYASSTSGAITLMGTQLAAPTLTPSTLSFGSQLLGNSTAAQVVTLQNTGTGILSIASITATGDFTQTNTCGSTVAAGASCTISVVYKPSTAGITSGTVTITDNAYPSSQTAALSGMGVVPTVGITPPSGAFVVNMNGSTAIGLTITPPSGYTGGIAFACKVAFKGSGTASNPPGCKFAPATATVINGAGTSTILTVTTGTASMSALLRLWQGTGTALAGSIFLFGIARRRWRGALLATLCTVMLGFAAGCSGSSNNISSKATATGSTAGSYTVTVTATAGTVTNTLDIPLTVQ